MPRIRLRNTANGSEARRGGSEGAASIPANGQQPRLSRMAKCPATPPKRSMPNTSERRTVIRTASTIIAITGCFGYTVVAPITRLTAAAPSLRTAVQNGYSQGYRQGQLDRQYRRSSNYNGSDLYRSGTFGYQSYVARNQYQHYFQQGFQRGYEDGYNSTFRYGTRSGNGFNILGNVLNTILSFTNN